MMKLKKTVLVVSVYSVMAGCYSTRPVFAQETTPQTAVPVPQDLRGVVLPKDYDITKIAQTKISVAVEDATLLDIIRAVSEATTEPKAIELRYPAFERISLKVKKVPLEDVLRGAANLNHLNLYVLPDRFVIGRLFIHQLERSMSCCESSILPAKRHRVKTIVSFALHKDYRN